jgi:hypothetical protein
MLECLFVCVSLLTIVYYYYNILLYILYTGRIGIGIGLIPGVGLRPPWKALSLSPKP